MREKALSPATATPHVRIFREEKHMFRVQTKRRMCVKSYRAVAISKKDSGNLSFLQKGYLGYVIMCTGNESAPRRSGLA